MRKIRARIWGVLLACAMLLALFPANTFAEPGDGTPASTTVIYVSQEGTQENDGSSAEQATNLVHATELANAAGNPAEIIVVGQVSVDTWTSPTVPTTLRGQDDTSELLFAYRPASDYKCNISMAGDLTIDQIRLNCAYTEYKLMAYRGTYTIVANGYHLIVKSGTKAAYFTSDTTVDGKRCSTSSCTVIGGGLNTDVSQGTHVEIYTSLPLTTVVGGGYDGNVSGDVYLLAQNCGKVQQILGGGYSNEKSIKVSGNIDFNFIDSVTDKAIYGGGYVNRNGASAVEGNITLNLSGMKNSFGFPVYGGGYGEEAPVTGKIVINAENIDLNNNKAGIYGGGSRGDVTGDIQINVKSSLLSKSIYGGGDYAAVNGNVEINISDCNDVISYIYGGGSNGGDVTGNVSITLSGGTTSLCPTIYATGKGKGSDESQVGGDAVISLNGSRATVYTMAEGGSVADGKSVTINLDDAQGLTGAVRGDSEKTQYIYNYEPNNTQRHVANTKVVVKGDYATTGIYYVKDIEIQQDGILREHLSDSDKKIFNSVENLVIDSEGTLDLLQANEISGTASVSGRLVMPKEADLTADGAVSVFEGAVYDPTDGYERYDVFLKTKTAYSQQEKTAFDVTEAGKAEYYYTADRAGTSQDIVHEWYVDQIQRVNIQPADITVYTGGKGYGGVVNDKGEIETDKENGLPEAGFYIELPAELDKQIKNELKVDEDTTLDLSKYLSFKSGDKSWTLALYDGEQTSIVNGKYIYRLVAAENQDPVRMQFTSGVEGDENKVETSDRFDLANALYSKYTMEIYPGAVEEGSVKAVISVNGKEAEYPVEALSGKLTIRGVTQKGETTEVVPKVDKAVNAITAVLPADTDYTINDSGVQVVDGAPALLVDEIVAPGNTQNGKDFRTLLTNKAAETVAKDFKNAASEARYLDLVDSANGNTWIKADRPVTIYWPYPAGTNADTEFRLVHFVDLNREMTVEEAENAIETTTVETIPVKTDAYGISFTTDSFSPFVLVWDNTQTTTVTEGKPDEHPDIAEAIANGTWGQPTPTPASSVIPQTGDSMPVMLLVILAVVAAGAVVTLVVLRKRNRR